MLNSKTLDVISIETHLVVRHVTYKGFYEMASIPKSKFVFYNV